MPADLTFERFDDEYATKMLGRKGRQGIDAYLGIVVTAFTPGRLVAEFEVRDELVTPLGSIHGGCLSVLVDHCLGVIMYPVMPPGYWAATTEIKTNYIAALKAGVLETESTVIAMTNRSAVVRGEVYAEGRLAAAAQAT